MIYLLKFLFVLSLLLIFDHFFSKFFNFSEMPIIEAIFLILIISFFIKRYQTSAP
jgi:hypothetical protein